MGIVDRSYGEIIKGLDGAAESLENLKLNAKRLAMEAEAAESELGDRVGKKDIQAIKDLAAAIQEAVKPGIARIRELKHEMKRQKDRFMEL